MLAVVGPQFSSEAEVSFPLGVRGETVMLTPMAAKPGIAGANRPWAFRFALTTKNDYRPLLDAWFKRQEKPIKKVVVLHDAKDAVSSFDGKCRFSDAAQGTRRRGARHDSFQTGDIDYSAQVTKAKGHSPDGIVVSALYNEAGNVTRELRKQGMNQPIVAGVGVNDPRFIQIAGPAAEGVMAAFDFFAENPNPAVAAWVSEFERRFKVQPSNAAGLMYDSLFLMRDCIMQLGLTGANIKAERVKLRDCWATMKDREAPLTGATSIDKNGDAVRTPVICRPRATGSWSQSNLQLGVAYQGPPAALRRRDPLLLQQLANGVMLGSTYALVAIGYALVFGVLRVCTLRMARCI